MHKPKLLLGPLFSSIPNLHRQLLHPEFLRSLTRRHGKFTMHQVDDTVLVLHEKQLVDRYGAVVERAAQAVADEHAHVAERARIEVALVHLVVEVGRIARREQKLVDFFEVSLDLLILGQRRILRAQAMPLLVSRRDQGVHGGRKTVERKRRRSIEHLFSATFALGLGDLSTLALEISLARNDAVGNILPNLLEIHALLPHALVLVEDVRSA